MMTVDNRPVALPASRRTHLNPRARREAFVGWLFVLPALLMYTVVIYLRRGRPERILANTALTLFAALYVGYLMSYVLRLRAPDLVEIEAVRLDPYLRYRLVAFSARVVSRAISMVRPISTICR